MAMRPCIAATDAIFALPQVTLGTQIVGGADLRMVSELGAARTKWLAMTGRRFGPAEAEAWGLVQMVVEPDALLRLRAEMRMPGRAWLQFEVTPADGGGSVISQTAIFDPAGLFGLAYWYALWPFHGYIFGGMLRRLARAATDLD